MNWLKSGRCGTLGDYSEKYGVGTPDILGFCRFSSAITRYLGKVGRGFWKREDQFLRTFDTSQGDVAPKRIRKKPVPALLKNKVFEDLKTSIEKREILPGAQRGVILDPIDSGDLKFPERAAVDYFRRLIADLGLKETYTAEKFQTVGGWAIQITNVLKPSS